MSAPTASTIPVFPHKSSGALLEALEDIFEAILRAVQHGNVDKEMEAINGQFQRVLASVGGPLGPVLNDPKWQVLWNFIWEWADEKDTPTMTEADFRKKHQGELEKAGVWGVREPGRPQSTPANTTQNVPNKVPPMLSPKSPPKQPVTITPTHPPDVPSTLAPEQLPTKSADRPKRLYVGKPPPGYIARQDKEQETLEGDEEEETEPEPEPVGAKRKRKSEEPTKPKKAKAATENNGDDMDVDPQDPPPPRDDTRDPKRGRVAPTLMGLVFRTPCERCRKLALAVRCRVKETTGKKKSQDPFAGACVNCNLAKVKCMGHSRGDVVPATVSNTERVAYEASFAHWAATEEANKGKATSKAENEKRPKEKASKKATDTAEAEVSRPQRSKTQTPKNADEQGQSRRPAATKPGAPEKEGSFCDPDVIVVSLPKKSTAQTTNKCPTKVARKLFEDIETINQAAAARAQVTSNERPPSPEHSETLEKRRQKKAQSGPGPSHIPADPPSSPVTPTLAALPTPLIDYGLPGVIDDADRVHLHSLPIPDLMCEVAQRIANHIEDNITSFLVDVDEQVLRRWTSLDGRLDNIENLFNARFNHLEKMMGQSHNIIKNKLNALQAAVDAMAHGPHTGTPPPPPQKTDASLSAGSPSSPANSLAHKDAAATTEVQPPSDPNSPRSRSASPEQQIPPSPVAVKITPPTPFGSQDANNDIISTTPRSHPDCLETADSPKCHPEMPSKPDTDDGTESFDLHTALMHTPPADPPNPLSESTSHADPEAQVVDNPTGGMHADPLSPLPTGRALEPPPTDLLTPNTPRRSPRVRSNSRASSRPPTPPPRRSRSRSPLPPVEDEQMES